MKMFIGSMLAKILNKMNFSVVIGCKIEGELTCLRNNQCFYSNDFQKTKSLYNNGQEFILPDGKFLIKSKLDEDNGKYIDWYTKIVNKIKK